MRQVEINFPLDAKPLSIRRVIETVCRAVGLSWTMKTTLRSFPGCTHWHFKRGDERGVLEATYWPAENRAWLSVQGGRAAEWIDGMMPRVKAAIETELSK